MKTIKIDNYKSIFFIIFIASIISDIFITKSNLTLPLTISTIISFTLTKFSIGKIKSLQLNQIIRKDGPQEHLNKEGTPTMGGLIVIPIGIIIGCLINTSKNFNEDLIFISAITLIYMIIGTIDDWKSLTNKRIQGLTARSKILLQLIASLLFVYSITITGILKSNIFLFSNYSIEIGIFIVPLAIFILIAESNATNLTDGLDGLAAGCGSLVFCGLGIQLLLRKNDMNPAVASYCLAMAGTWLGFLIHNKYPAKIFMGDTGSLAMGASLGSIALITNSLWALLIMGGIFFAETISVIIQVGIFKITKRFVGVGKRVLKMAPLHHHFEIEGKKENDIVKSFWITNLFLVILGIIFRSS